MARAALKSKAGRPRKTNVVRDRTGKSRGEIVDFSVVLNQPHRRGFSDKRSELLGYPLGRLRAESQISEIQLRAGNEWALMVRSYAGMMGVPFGSPRSGSLLSDSGKGLGRMLKNTKSAAERLGRNMTVVLRG
jgi:hypothetical protein